VLFIGNSFTDFNGGQALIVRRLATSATTRPARLPMCDQSTNFGATLEWHWKHGEARQRIGEGNWDYVVLQEHSEQPLKKGEDFFKYAKLLDAEIRKVKAKTVLYMTMAEGERAGRMGRCWLRHTSGWGGRWGRCGAGGAGIHGGARKGESLHGRWQTSHGGGFVSGGVLLLPLLLSAADAWPERHGGG